MQAGWFEAGAVSKAIENSMLVPYLFGFEHRTDVTGPLAQFQATFSDKEGTQDLIRTINRARGSDALEEGRFDEAFDKWWPDLEAKIKATPESEEAPVESRNEK